MNRAGFPAHISPAGTSLVTTDPIPITASSPNVTPFRMMTFPPMNARFLDDYWF